MRAARVALDARAVAGRAARASDARGRVRGRGGGVGARRARANDDENERERAFDAILDELSASEGDVASERGEDVSDDALLADAAANPYFNDAFREALAEAQGRIREERERNKAKIDSEVAEIMNRVRAERALRASGEGTVDAPRGESSRPREPAPAPEAARERDPEPQGVREPEREAPKIVNKQKMAESVPAVMAYDPEFTDLIERHLLEMAETSKASIAKLTNARNAVEESLANEKRQLARLEMLMDRVQREIRYRRADEAVRKRREQ